MTPAQRATLGCLASLAIDGALAHTRLGRAPWYTSFTSYDVADLSQAKPRVEAIHLAALWRAGYAERFTDRHGLHRYRPSLAGLRTVLTSNP